MSQSVIIRDFNPATDYPGAYRSFCSGFHHTLWPMLDEADEGFIYDLLRATYAYGNKAVVAEVDGEVVGILFGTAPFSRARLRPAGREVARMIYRMVTGRYGMSRLAVKHFFQVMYGFSPFLYKHPPCPYEITLFTSIKEFRGRGLGRKMMDAYIREVADQEAKYATVCTDSCLSWHFYKAYGFKRIVTFPMSAYKYSMPEEKVEGYIYSLRIDKRYTDYAD